MKWPCLVLIQLAVLGHAFLAPTKSVGDRFAAKGKPKAKPQGEKKPWQTVELATHPKAKASAAPSKQKLSVSPAPQKKALQQAAPKPEAKPQAEGKPTVAASQPATAKVKDGCPVMFPFELTSAHITTTFNTIPSFSKACYHFIYSAAHNVSSDEARLPQLLTPLCKGGSVEQCNGWIGGLHEIISKKLARSEKKNNPQDNKPAQKKKQDRLSHDLVEAARAVYGQEHLAGQPGGYGAWCTSLYNDMVKPPCEVVPTTTTTTITTTTTAAPSKHQKSAPKKPASKPAQKGLSDGPGAEYWRAQQLLHSGAAPAKTAQAPPASQQKSSDGKDCACVHRNGKKVCHCTGESETAKAVAKKRSESKTTAAATSQSGGKGASKPAKAADASSHMRGPAAAKSKASAAATGKEADMFKKAHNDDADDLHALFTKAHHEAKKLR